MKYLRIALGILAWVAGTWALWACVRDRLLARRTAPQRVAGDLWEFASGSREPAHLVLETPQTVAVGDPIFVVDGPDSIRQVGEIRALIDPATGRPARRGDVLAAEALFYPDAPRLAPSAELTYYSTTDSMTWVVQTLLPRAKRQQIAHELAVAFEEHHAEILAALRPIVEDSLREALHVVEQDLPPAIARHRLELEQLGAKYQREIVQQEIVPLVREEIWPAAQARAMPVAEEVGKELWGRVSLWRFGWRYLYDRSPLPEKNLVRSEWNRFVEQDAAPVLEGHTDDFVRLTQQVLADAAKNPQVRAVLRESLGRIVDDPELQHIVWQIIREVIIDNPRLRDVIDQHWTGEQAKAAFRLAAQRLEPAVRRIGDLVIGTRDGGITPEFARVLRNQVLGKDRRWFVLTVPEGSSGTSTPPRYLRQPVVLGVRIGSGEPVNPFVVPTGQASLHE
jgi:hypothetical protein